MLTVYDSVIKNASFQNIVCIIIIIIVVIIIYKLMKTFRTTHYTYSRGRQISGNNLHEHFMYIGSTSLNIETHLYIIFL